MPGNELGERVHNFFAQDNSLQGQHHSQAVGGNWPVLNNNFWVGSQRQVDLLNSNNKNYSSKNSDIDRGEGSYPLHVTHGLNFPQSNLRPDFTNTQSLNEQPNLNGFTYEHQFHQTRQSGANFLAVDRDSDQRHYITSKGFSFRELQQDSGPDHQTKSSVRSETSGSPVSFDLFGGQQQISHQQSSTPQPLQHQPSGTSNMQQLQQQLMIRKMQELQRQQQLQQLDLRQQNLMNELAPFAKQTSGTQSTLVNGTPSSDTLQYPWAAHHGKNWLNRGSPAMQGSPMGHGLQPNLGQAQRLTDLVPQQVDQSLYGVPVSSSRGLPVNQHSQMVTSRSSMPEMPISSNFIQSNQPNLLPDQVGIQNEYSISRHKVQNENMFGLASGQSLSTGIRNMGGLQHVNSMSRNALQQDFLGRQELVVRSETSHEKPTMQVASPQNEVTLDPTEEKILFGSDDNIWAAFGKVPHMSGEGGNSFDNGGLSNDFPSIHSGSWSALMQSAVAETSSSEVPQEEWSGLIYNDGPSGNQPPSTRNDSCKRDTYLTNGNMRTPSALNSESFSPSDDIGTTNVMGFNQLGQNFQNEPEQTLHTVMSERYFQSLEESANMPNSDPRQNLVAKQSQVHGDSSQHPLQADISAKTNSPSWTPGRTGTRLQSNDWNALAAIPHGGDRETITHEAEKSQQISQNNQVRVMQGEVVHGSSLWKSNYVPSSAIELGHPNSRVSNHQEDKGILSLKDASVAKSCNAGINGETSSFVQNNNSLNQWKDAYSPARSQDGGRRGRPLHQANDPNQVRVKGEVPRNEMEHCDGKENSNDSHRSNLSQRTSGGFREGGLSDVSDSQSLPTAKQKSTNQLARNVSAPRKFQYHPMGNVDEDVEPTYGLKQPNLVQAMSQQNAHFGQSKIFGQVPRSSTVMEKGHSSELYKDTKGTDEELSQGNLSGHAPNMPVPFRQPIDAHISRNASSSSQNMLELLHKVDQSGNHGAMMQFSSSEHKSSSQLPEAENFDGFGRLQRSQSSLSQGFGLQLGPPSQKLQISNHPYSSQNGQGTFNSLYSGSAAAGMGDKGQQMVASRSVQSLPSAEETQVEFGLSRSTTPGHGGNEDSLYKTPGNFTSAFQSGTPYSGVNVQNQEITSVSGQMSMKQHIDAFNGNALYSAQRSVESLLPDASGSFRQDNLASSGGMHRQSGPNDVQERIPMASTRSTDHEQSSRHFSVPSIGRQGDSAQMLNSMWTSVHKLQHNMGIQFQQVSSRTPESPLPNIVESSSVPLIQDYANSQGVVDREEQRLKERSGQPVASMNTNLVPKMKRSLGKASSVENCLDDSPANSGSTQRNIEAFGRSLKPNSYSYQNYSSQNLMDGETDSSNRVSKMMRGPDNFADAQQAALKAGLQNEHNAVAGDSLGSSSGVPIEDSKILGSSRPPDILQRTTSQQGNVASHDSLGIRNGQMLQIYDASKVTPSRPGDFFTPGKASSGFVTPNLEKGTAAPVDACQINSSHQASLLVADGHSTSPQSSQLNVINQHLVTLRPKKRKSATSELHPWHKEISEGSQDLWTLSMAEADWNKAANCLPDKVEDYAELIEDGPPLVRSRRRLLSSTRFMQQLFRPARRDVLCADASSNYEIVAYTVSRRALGDACSMASRSSNLDLPCNGMDLRLVKGRSTERNGGQCYAKATEQLMGRARKLENDFLRLDKSASILDLRVESQDLEKFSIINRFARFHGRGQTDNAETASTDGNASIQKPTPQRYVTALPMPRNLPDRAQCLSL